jgi:hypothetical protein
MWEDHGSGQPGQRARPYLQNNQSGKGLGAWLKWQSTCLASISPLLPKRKPQKICQASLVQCGKMLVMSRTGVLHCSITGSESSARPSTHWTPVVFPAHLHSPRYTVIKIVFRQCHMSPGRQSLHWESLIQDKNLSNQQMIKHNKIVK